MVPDSASTATALFSGVKTNYKVIGVDNNVALDDCDSSLNPDFHTKSIIEWAQESGKDTGLFKILFFTILTSSLIINPLQAS